MQDSNIHDLLVQKGYRRKAGKHVIYEKTYVILGKEFSIELSDIDLSFLHLPLARLVSLPDGLPNLLPHVMSGGYLCYLDYEGVNFDRFKPELYLGYIDASIERLLKSFCDGTDLSKQIVNEFSAYWDKDIHFHAYLDEKVGKTSAKEYKRKKLNGDERYEILVSDNKSIVKAWVSNRNVIEGTTSNIYGYVFEVSFDPLVPFDMKWPPNTFKKFYDWINLLSPDTANKLLKEIAANKRKGTMVFIFKTQTANFGIFIRIDPAAKLREVSKKNKKTISPNLKKILTIDRIVKKYERTSISDVSESTLMKRTIGECGLENKRIALVGCGSIGGYCAHLLVQSGAATGTGQLYFYDGDILSANNLGRHILEAKYVGEQKSTALKHKLKSIFVGDATNIADSGNWESELFDFRNFDIVIDATGNYQLSVEMAYQYRRSVGQRSLLLHGWVDAAGKASRSLLDDKKNACFRCLKDHDLNERFPLVSNKNRKELPEIIRNCGDSYMPYSCDAAISAAGLILRSALDHVNNKTSPRFRHLSLDKIVQNRHFSNVDQWSECPCCQNI